MEQREIKFRAWNFQDKEMHDVEDLGMGEASWETVARNVHKKGTHNSFYGEKRNSVLMQYTGLKDKNGEEIYEGDILRFQSRSLLQDAMTTKVMPIIWHQDRLCWWVGDQDKGFHPVMTVDNNEFEVIGNILENPDLLTNNPTE